MAQHAPATASGDDSEGLGPAPAIPYQSLSAVFLRFLRFGLLAWGGPVAQIAMIQRELVEEQRWISPARFRRALAVYQVLPGPEAHELCVYFGMLARGRIGAVLAGLGFMLPGFLLMLGLSALYVGGSLRPVWLQPLFVGLQAAMIAMVVRALMRIGHHALHDRWLLGIAALACTATLLGAHFAWALAFGGVLWMLVRRAQWRLAALAGALAAVWLTIELMLASPIVGSRPAAPVIVSPSTLTLFTSGLRAGLLTFGGAYTAIPFLQHDAVDAGWMTNDQFLEGVGLSGVLPAPLIIFATFVGYVGNGLLGALAMTTGIFLPAFGFTLAGHTAFERVTGNMAVHDFLDGVTAGVVGIMAATTIGLVGDGIRDWRSALIAVAGLGVLWFWSSRAAIPVTVLGGGLLGLAIL
jgi:chromate transporter